jgi:hypothetical protein
VENRDPENPMTPFLSKRVLSPSGRPTSFIFVPFRLRSGDDGLYYVVGELNIRHYMVTALQTVIGKDVGLLIADYQGDITSFDVQISSSRATSSLWSEGHSCRRTGTSTTSGRRRPSGLVRCLPRRGQGAQSHERCFRITTSIGPSAPRSPTRRSRADRASARNLFIGWRSLRPDHRRRLGLGRAARATWAAERSCAGSTEGHLLRDVARTQDARGEAAMQLEILLPSSTPTGSRRRSCGRSPSWRRASAASRASCATSST